MGRELLLVEPNPEVAETLRRAFGPAGFEVETLAAGEPAVDRCRTSRPDVVLLSAELPDMSGFSVCNRIKRSVSGLPVILYTREDADAAVAAHRLTRTRADEYLRAPLDLASVVARASQLIGDAAATLASGGAEVLAVGRAAVAPLSLVKDAMAAQRTEVAELRERLDALRRRSTDSERARLELERLLGDARAALEEREARRAELERRLTESETTRQALSDVLSETMQRQEAADREWSQRLSAEAEKNAAAAIAPDGASRPGAAEGAEMERRHQAEVLRQKQALVDLERRLEASARAEALARRRIADLEKERTERSAEGDRLASAEQALGRAREELADLRTENDFLNGEIARYTQKNRDLLARLQQRSS